MNIIIQAGGKGTRLGRHTKNKPKCLVEFDGKTLLQRQLELYKGNKIIIIGDYKIDILKKYVTTFFGEYNALIVDAKGGKGTLSGLRAALSRIDNDDPIAFMWSDIVFDEPLIHRESDIQVFTTTNFLCRYRLSDNNEIIKERSTNDGIMGAFTIKNKHILSSIPETGSFVSGWLNNNIDKFNVLKTRVSFVREVGELHHLDREFQNTTSRFFNSIQIKEDEVIKECIDREYAHLIEDEQRWYKKTTALGFKNIPKVFSYEPFKMKRIHGEQCHKVKDIWSKNKKKEVLKKVCETLNSLHELREIPSNNQHMKDMYEIKTLKRVEMVRRILPFMEYSVLSINNKEYENPFHKSRKEKFINKVRSLQTGTFNIIHGDPTFNNFIVSADNTITLYDPRGSFSDTKIFGDKRYDWAKLYYSVVGNYDSVNEKRFEIEYNENKISYNIDSNKWEFLEEELIKLSRVNKKEILLINCLIWFSLCGYLRDYDSILMAYVKGVELWQRI